MKKYYALYAFVWLSIFCISCNKFLDLKPQASATTDNFYKTQSDFNAAVIACYSALRSYPGTEIFPLVEYRSDNMFVKAYTSGSQDQYQINKFTDVTSNSLNSAAWADMYNGIFKCNEVISRIGTVQVSNQFTQALKNQYEGETRFIRALYYFTLVRLYGGVPLVKTPITATQALTLKRATVADTYQLIEEDLDSAINQLPETYAATDLGRVRQSAAKVLLAKVLLTEGKYSDAQALLSNVIINATALKYSLQTSVAGTGTGLFSVSNEMNQEIIFAIRFAKSLTGGGHGAWFNPGSDTTTSEINTVLKSTYNTADARKSLLSFTKSGSVYYINKYYDVADATTKNFDNDFIVLRYADVLLMYAECLNQTGALSNSLTDQTQALYWLNLVRKRAYPTGAYTVAQCTNQAAVQQLILNERWLEFPLEGQRWFDLLRTQNAKIYILQNSGNSSTNGTLTPQAVVTDVPDYRLIYPVPDAEVQKINDLNIFPQNPGY